jgi:hypothetical protein
LLLLFSAMDWVLAGFGALSGVALLPVKNRNSIFGRHR